MGLIQSLNGNPHNCIDRRIVREFSIAFDIRRVLQVFKVEVEPFLPSLDLIDSRHDGQLR
jgi:hypothetical protein